ncbi:hypothetical protein FCG41_23190, partial [Azotobacter chroococcum]
MQPIPCVLMRGGTSKGPVSCQRPVRFAPGAHEPLLTIMGSGHEPEIDGTRGGSTQTRCLFGTTVQSKLFSKRHEHSCPEWNGAGTHHRVPTPPLPRRKT